MKNIKIFILLYILIFGAFTFICGTENIKNIEEYIESINELRSQDSLNLKIYVKLINNYTLVEIKDTKNWPDSIDYTLNIYFDAKGNPIIFGLYPYSESGDWDLNLEHYFDENENTIYFKYYLGFFNSICTEILREYKHFYFDKSFKLIHSKLEYYDIDNQPIDTSGCIFNYNFDFKYYKNYEEVLKNQAPFHKINH